VGEKNAGQRCGEKEKKLLADVARRCTREDKGCCAGKVSTIERGAPTDCPYGGEEGGMSYYRSAPKEGLRKGKRRTQLCCLGTQAKGFVSRRTKRGLGRGRGEKPLRGAWERRLD